MHYVMTPVGSSGDVHPFVGIGAGLLARGHRVTVVTAEPFRQVATGAGLGFVPTWSEDEYLHALDDPDLWHQRKGLAVTLRRVAGLVDRTYRILSDLYEPGATVLVGHTLAFGTRVFEDKHGAPAATLHVAPNVFRSDFQQPVFGPNAMDLTRLPRFAKRAIWAALDRLAVDPLIRPPLNRFRRSLGLKRVSRIFNGWLHSPHAVIGLFPDWFAPPQRDWPAVQLTGFPLFDEAARADLPEDLESFLAGGDPPVVFTPGTANRHARAFFEAALDATRRLGCRAVFLTRFADQLPPDLPPQARAVGYAPFSRLLPRSVAIVHHGGIGTCAQGLAAGVPQVVMPYNYDQPDNAMRLVRLHVGAMIPVARFTGERVAKGLAELLHSDRTRAACERCREWMAAADAVGRTCEILEDIA